MSNSTGPHPALDDPNAFVFYRYHPSMGAAVIFAILFMGCTIVHMCQMCKTKAWYYTPFIIGGVLETIGYIGRAASSKDQWNLSPYLVQTLCLLVAPAFFAASIYMVLGRIILLVQGERCSLIRKKWMTKIFVTGDILSFLLQAGGGGIMSSGSLSAMHTGEHIVIVGLFVQFVFFGFFLVVATTFHRRIRKAPTALSSPVSEIGTTWEKYLVMLYVVSLLIMVRSIFRVVEYIGGNDGSIMRHEVFVYVFDATLMVSVMLLFNIRHPGNLTVLEKGLGGSELDRLTFDRGQVQGGLAWKN
ncbi:RTA1 like protein-domain-containing protein [Xylogone sp. PMI_703]|nr:RTA1 like protein-domain-containing protein [Xylogone sp. PMI_703]